MVVLFLWPLDLTFYVMRWIYGEGPLSDLWPRMGYVAKSVGYALWWIFLSPWMPFIRTFLLFPIDLALYMIQFAAWLLSAFPVFGFAAWLGY